MERKPLNRYAIFALTALLVVAAMLLFADSALANNWHYVADAPHLLDKVTCWQLVERYEGTLPATLMFRALPPKSCGGQHLTVPVGSIHPITILGWSPGQPFGDHNPGSIWLVYATSNPLRTDTMRVVHGR